MNVGTTIYAWSGQLHSVHRHERDVGQLMHFGTSPTPIGCMPGICPVESSGYNKGTEVIRVKVAWRYKTSRFKDMHDIGHERQSWKRSTVSSRYKFSRGSRQGPCMDSMEPPFTVAECWEGGSKTVNLTKKINKKSSLFLSNEHAH